MSKHAQQSEATSGAPGAPAARPRILLVTPLETRFSRDIFHGIVAFARQHTNWRLICHATINAVEQRKLQLSGVLLPSGDPQVRQMVRHAGLPAVLVGHTDLGGEVSSVSVDERKLGAMAADYLAGLGLRHFAYVGHGDWPFVRERRDSFVAGVKALGAGPVQQHIGFLYDRRRRAGFIKELHAMLQRLPRPCGLLAANDALGVEIVAACQNIGLRVPDDIAVLGVDDDEVACEMSEVPLSSVAQPLHAIGYEAARLLQQHMQQPPKPPTQLFLPPLRIVARASSDLIALDDADVVAALRLINDHFAQPIGVAWIVDRLPVARRSLERKFKALVGRTILEQIHHIRFAKARELLAESDLALEVVAQRSGFANARWMADSFRRELHITPNRFRRQFRTEA